MDSFSENWSGLTESDRADRARKAWELYRGEHTDGVTVPDENRVADLITDLLHLAETDGHPGGASEAAAWALLNYAEELPAGSGGSEADAVPVGGALYCAQVCGVHTRDLAADGAEGWLTVAIGGDRRVVAEQLRKPMQLNGIYYSDLHFLVQDLVEGKVVTSDVGFSFRVIEHAS
ncbi:hypothetical protein AB0D00_26710 [Streptomyces sp. NPDC048213]|uniref:hypothetical protein n=1 Tax=Streptomyces sp. NPDC048213 TaxID=3160984 RepID=UPI0033BFC40B